MNLDAVITQLKTYAPIFAQSVAGAASYAGDMANQTWLSLPAAYVVPLEDEAEPNANQTGYYAMIREKIGVIVVLDNSADRRGQAAATQSVDAVRKAVLAALLNWRPDEKYQARGFSYVYGGMHPDGLDRARLRWQFDFAIETTITDADGWQPPSVPLTGIGVNPPDVPALAAPPPAPSALFELPTS